MDNDTRECLHNLTANQIRAYYRNSLIGIAITAAANYPEATPISELDEKSNTENVLITSNGSDNTYNIHHAYGPVLEAIGEYINAHPEYEEAGNKFFKFLEIHWDTSFLEDAFAEENKTFAELAYKLSDWTNLAELYFPDDPPWVDDVEVHLMSYLEPMPPEMEKMVKEADTGHNNT